MMRNYFLVIWRSFTKSKTYTFLNVFGITIGISCAIVMFVYVQDELTYDHNHSNLEDIYRLNGAYRLPGNGGKEEYALCGPGVGEVLIKDFPEIRELVRVHKLNDVVVQKPGTDEKFYEQFAVADSNFFKIFTFSFVAENSNDRLMDSRTLAISERTALKYFNSTNVLGRTLLLPNDSVELTISAVFANPPSNTQFKFDFVLPLETYRTMGHKINMQNWWSYGYYTYLLLNSKADVKSLADKIRFISRKYIADQEDDSGYRQEYSLTALKDVHLYSNLRQEIEANGKITYVYAFIIVGVFILMIACINFMNLATARAAKRSKEVGIRKVVGAMRMQLIWQFLGESFAMTICGALFSTVIVTLTLPIINNFVSKDLHFASDMRVWGMLALIILFVGVTAGFYPSIFLSAFKPVETIKGSLSSGSGNWLRKSLVVFQFFISTFLIAGTLVIYVQVKYLRSIDLGFDKERIVYLPIRNATNLDKSYDYFKRELKRMAYVKEASLSSQVPGIDMGNTVVRKGWDEKASWSDMRIITVDYDFIAMYNLSMVSGRSFDEQYPSDRESGIILNESGMRRLGWHSAIGAVGQRIKVFGKNGQVIGVMKDFHFMSSNLVIEPFIMIMNSSEREDYLSIKLEKGNPTDQLDQIRGLFATVLPGRIFEYHFLEEDYDKQYKSEDQFMMIFLFFACVAICIACLGLYGLAMYMSELKLKEIGIRKILGASEKGLITMITKDFIILVVVSVLFALPMTYFAMNEWLASFPLHETIGAFILVVSGGISICIAFLTVSTQSYKAATANPIDIIRAQ